MGQQQLLLIILGVIIVGIAIAVGLNLFQAGSIGANQDAMVSDMMNIAAHSDQWRIRPATMGGGDGEFTGYDTVFDNNDRLNDTGNGEYTVTVTASTIQIDGDSKLGFGNIRLVYDPSQATEAARYVWSSDGEFDVGGDITN